MACQLAQSTLQWKQQHFGDNHEICIFGIIGVKYWGVWLL